MQAESFDKRAKPFSDSVKTASLFPDVAFPLCTSYDEITASSYEQSPRTRSWELQGGCRKRRVCCQLEAMSLLLSSPLFASLLCSALLGQSFQSAGWAHYQTPGYGTWHSPIAKAERAREGESEPWSDATSDKTRPKSPPHVAGFLISGLTALSDSSRHFPAGFGLVVGCGLVLTAVPVLLTPPPLPTE